MSLTETNEASNRRRKCQLIPVGHSALDPMQHPARIQPSSTLHHVFCCILNIGFDSLYSAVSAVKCVIVNQNPSSMKPSGNSLAWVLPTKHPCFLEAPVPHVLEGDSLHRHTCRKQLLVDVSRHRKSRSLRASECKNDYLCFAAVLP